MKRHLAPDILCSHVASLPRNQKAADLLSFYRGLLTGYDFFSTR